MVGTQHHRRLEKMYAESEGARTGSRVMVSFGRALVDGSIDRTSGDVVPRMLHQHLLDDAAALAANSLDKTSAVTAKRFDAQVHDADYRGPVFATAQVVLALDEAYVVQAALQTPEGTTVATARGVFVSSGERLSADASTDETPQRGNLPPASFLSAHKTPFGMVSMN